MLRRIPAALTLLLAAVTCAWPQFAAEEAEAAQKNRAQFTLDEQTVRIAKLGESARPSTVRTRKPKEGEDDGDPAPAPGEGVVNTGLKVWKIIADNKPVVSVNVQYATALPKGATRWQDMAGWRQPAGTLYEFSARNAFGLRVIHVRYQVLRTYGGSYGGKGKYLTAVTVEPLLVEVAWGYHLSLEASVPDASVVNVGTSQDPVAGMMAQLGWRVSSAIKDTSGQGLYFLQGDGAFREVAGPFSSLSLEKARANAAAFASRPPNFE